MQPALKLLCQIQDVEDRLRVVEEKLAEAPRRIAELQAETARREETVAQAQARLEEDRKKQRDLEQEMEDTETQEKKYKGQLLQVKTNEEYTAMQHEIAHARDRVSEIETQILVLMEGREAIERELAERQQEAAAWRKQAEAEQAALEKDMEEWAGQQERFQREDQTLKEQLPVEVLAQFEQVAESRGGTAVARVRDYLCAMCKVRVRPQVYQELLMTDKIYTCDGCKRILVPADSNQTDA